MNICAAVLVALPFVACQQEELVKPSALMSDSSLTFAATDAEAQTFTVASDAYWMIDVAESWLTVEPMEGTGTQTVTVYVEDNVKDGAVDRPRQATITIADLKGYSVKTMIYQNGDNYLGVNEMSLSAVRSLEDEEFAKVSEAQVVALTSEGFVATDASASLYVTSSAEVALGDKVYLAGEKGTLYGNAVLKAGDVTVKSNAAVTHPSAVDLATNLDPAKADKVVYVSTYAGLLGTTLKYESSLPVSVSLLDPKTGTFDLESVNMHNLSIEAYFIGLDKGEVKLALTQFEDNGINENLKAYFYDDFSWMKPYLEAHASQGGKVVGDSVGEDNASAEAPNLRTTSTLENLLDELLARGYEDLNKEAKVIYPQAYYWKFGKTSEATKNNNGGMKLPALELQGSELLNIDLEFDWSPHMTGSGNIDKVSVVAEIVEGNGSFDNGTKVSDPFLNECTKGDLKWHHVKTMIRGANNTTRIVIRPYEYNSVTPDQQRWHLDNIKISDSDIPYSDPVYANVALSEELVTFEGVPAGPVELTIKSDNPWTLTKSLDSDWFEVDVTEGAAGEEVKVTVTCQSSTVSTLRKGSLMLASADTRKNIYVVQSAAGGELDPLISVNGGNIVNVDGLKGEFTLEVQSNVEYTISTDVDWLSVVETPATKGIVEKFSHTFAKTDNLSGATRTGHIIFTAKNQTLAVAVNQEKFEPYVVAAPVYKTQYVSGYGCTLTYSIKANVPYTVTTDADWVKLPAAAGPAQDITLPIQFLQNTTEAVRTATVTFTNEEYNYTAVHTINQYPAGVVFQEDFSWMAPMIAAYNAAASTPIGDTVGTNGKKGESPNAYTASAWLATDFWTVFSAMGYENTNPSGKVLYPQDAYLKFGKTGVHSGLYLPSVAPEGDVTLTFNWCAQVQGSGVIDPVKMLVELEGDGTCADTGTKISTPTASTQETNTYTWQTYSVVLKGVTPATRILIRHNDMSSGKAIRFHLDNIKMTK